MLLAIAVANSVTVWATNIDNPMVGTHIGIVMNDSLWDKIAIMIGAMFIHVRGLPMFATLLGYGMGIFCSSGTSCSCTAFSPCTSS